MKSPDKLSAETVLQDSSLAEGAAGLLAMTSTADRAQDDQVNPLLFSGLLLSLAKYSVLIACLDLICWCHSSCL